MKKHEFSNKVKDLNGSAIREMFKMVAFPDMISFAGGSPAKEIYPKEDLAKIASDILSKQGDVALQYGITEGYAPLIEQVKERWGKRGIYREGIDEVLITAGGQQALALVAKCFLNEGDTVAVENPSFIGALNAFRSNGAKLAGVPMDDDGIRISEIPENKLLYVIPNFQNPSGITMSATKRTEILKQDTLILEDDPYGDLRFRGEHLPSIKEQDTDGRVIYISTFSKILAPGLRVGLIIAPKDLIEKMVVCKQGEDVHTAVISQMIVSEYMKRHDLEELIEKERALYGKKYEIMREAIERHFPSDVKVTEPEGGLFLWVSGIREGIDVVDEALKAGVLVIAGKGFMANGENVNEFRMNYSLSTPEDIETGIGLLGKVLK